MRAEKLEELKALKQRAAEAEAKLALYADNDPALLEEMSAFPGVPCSPAQLLGGWNCSNSLLYCSISVFKDLLVQSPKLQPVKPFKLLISSCTRPP